MKKIDLKTFERNLDIYSADLSRWPQDLVHPALALCKVDPRAVALFDDALALDDVLRRAEVFAGNAEDCVARVMAQVDRMPAAAAVRKERTGSFLPPAAFSTGAVFALVLAFLTGFSNAGADAATTQDILAMADADQALQMMAGVDEEELSDIVEGVI